MLTWDSRGICVFSWTARSNVKIKLNHDLYPNLFMLEHVFALLNFVFSLTYKCLPGAALESIFVLSWTARPRVHRPGLRPKSLFASPCVCIA